MANQPCTQNSPLIGIVTVLFHGADLLDDFFASIQRQTGIAIKIYFIDNSPNRVAYDRVEELNRRYGFDIAVVYNGANYGVAKGNNIGIRLALADGCDYVLLSNYDIDIPQSNAIATLVTTAAGTENALWAPKIYYHGNKTLWYAGGHIDYLRGISPHHGDGEIDDGSHDQTGFTEYAPTCFMLIHRSTFERVGMMDEKYFVYLDDTDFVARCARLGIRVYYVPQARIEHKVSQTTGGNWSEFSVKQTNKNRIYFLKKNKNVAYAVVCTIYLYLFFVKHAKTLWNVRRTYFSAIREGWRLS